MTVSSVRQTGRSTCCDGRVSERDLSGVPRNALESPSQPGLIRGLANDRFSDGFTRSAQKPNITAMVPIGTPLYRGIKVDMSDEQIVALLTQPSLVLAAGAARSGSDHVAPVREAAHGLLEQPGALSRELGKHINGLMAGKSYWVSTSSDKDVAIYFAKGSDQRSLVVSFAAPKASVDVNRAAQTLGLAPTGQPLRPGESEVVVPGGISPEQITEITEYSYRMLEVARNFTVPIAFPLQRWVRTADGVRHELCDPEETIRYPNPP